MILLFFVNIHLKGPPVSLPRMILKSFKLTDRFRLSLFIKILSIYISVSVVYLCFLTEIWLVLYSKIFCEDILLWGLTGICKVLIILMGTWLGLSWILWILGVEARERWIWVSIYLSMTLILLRKSIPIIPSYASIYTYSIMSLLPRT